MSYVNVSGILVGERWFDTDSASLNSEGSKISREYRVWSPSQTTTLDDLAVAGALAIATPQLRGNLIRRQVDLKRYSQWGWYATISWETFKPGDVDTYSETIKISTSGNTAEVTCAINHVASYEPDGEILDEARMHGGLMNIKREGGKIVSQKGVETVVRQLEVSIEKTFPAGTVDNDYIQTLYGLTGTVNHSPFRGYSAGEVLFLGADVTLNNLEKETVSYGFSLSPNVINLKIGLVGGYTVASTITVASKKGHDYLWVEYASKVTEAQSKKQRVGRPLKAHVEQVYALGNFSLLGL